MEDRKRQKLHETNIFPHWLLNKEEEEKRKIADVFHRMSYTT